MTPTKGIVLFLLKETAKEFGLYSSWRANSKISLLVSPLISALLFSARDTVVIDTPNLSAMSLSFVLLLNFFFYLFKKCKNRYFFTFRKRLR